MLKQKMKDLLFIDQEQKRLSLIYLFIMIVAFLILLKKHAWLQSDTDSYINGSVTRSMLYHFILKAYLNFFPDDFAQYPKKWHVYYTPLVFMQLLFGFIVAAYSSSKLKTLLKLPSIWVIPISAILLTPYFLPTKIGNAILTEAICYPLFLLSMISLLDGVVYKKESGFYKFFIFTALLMITRRQFIFLYPLFICVLIYLMFFAKQKVRGGVVATVFVFSVIATNLIERSYHYVKHDHFKTVPFTGFHLIAYGLYIADPEDADLFDGVEKEIFINSYSQMQEQGIVLKRINVKPSSLRGGSYDRFHNGFDQITYRILGPQLNKSGLSKKGWFEIDRVTTKMSLALILDNFDEYFSLYKKNIASNMGGDFNAVLIFITLVLALGFHMKNRDDISLIVFFVTLANVGNYMTVAILQVVLYRYSLYTDSLQYVILLVLIYNSLKVGCAQDGNCKSKN